MAWNGTVTNGGLTLLQNWITGGGTLAVDSPKTGTGTVPLAQLMGQTDVAGTARAVSIAGYSKVANGVKYSVQIPAANSAYTAMQIGVFARIGSGPVTLLALFQADEGDGIVVPATADMPDFSTIFTALVQMANTGTLNVTIDSTALVSLGQMEDALEDYVAIASVASLQEALVYLGLAEDE